MTNDHKMDGRYTQLCTSSTDGATGVKQLSALAAPGEKMLLNQEGFSNSPSLQGNTKPGGVRGRREQQWKPFVWMSWFNRWAMGGGISKHLTRQRRRRRKKTAPQAQYQECPPHTVTQSARTSQQTRVYPDSSPCSDCSVCFELGERRPPLDKKKMLKQKEKGVGGQKWKEQPRPPWLQWLFLFECHRVEFLFACPPISRGRHQSCTCARGASALVAALKRFCFVKDPA